MSFVTERGWGEPIIEALNDRWLEIRAVEHSSMLSVLEADVDSGEAHAIVLGHNSMLWFCWTTWQVGVRQDASAWRSLEVWAC